jgi:general secretion pathway protein D
MKKLIFLLAILVAGCATHDSFRESRELIESGNEAEGLAQLEKLVQENPKDVELKNYYVSRREAALQRQLALGDQARSAGAFERAAAAYQQALAYDPENARAKQGLAAIEVDRQDRAQLAQASEALQRGDEDAAYETAKRVLQRNPQSREARSLVRRVEAAQVKAETTPPELGEALKKPITLEFRDAPLRSVFELIGKQAGLNFIFDRDVQPDLKTTVFVRDTTIDDVIRFVLVTNQLERKVLNEKTVLIYPATAAKQQAYRELIVKSFYLANADVKQTANMVRQLVKTRDLFVDEKLNLLVIRDTPEAVRMVEKLVAAQDLVEPEVMLEVEVLEVGHTQLSAVGIQWPGQVSLGLQGAENIRGQITGREAQAFNGSLVRLNVSDPMIALNLRSQAGRTSVLANPRIRVKNREKARIHIGDKVPVITTTAGATGFVSEAVNYLDVGLKLEVEPNVFLEDDVGIKVGLEVSNISREIKSGSGTLAYQVGTRNAATTLRLRDGETQVLAGLINDEDRRNAQKVPGLSRLPVLGRLFSSNDDTVNKTEIVLLITPHIVRNIERPAARIEEFKSGTEAEVGGAGVSLQPVPSSFAEPARSAPSEPAAPAPSIPAPASPLPPASGPQPPAAGPQPAQPQQQR